ncbi:olfactory receptor 5V1-like [Hyperolius riggenbachi]|uniref:olfactory receptor 5V1-like n=1 Tax=Hyperolius riggenbachi TaxID=752182 RepID=UPI0035A33E25
MEPGHENNSNIHNTFHILAFSKLSHLSSVLFVLLLFMYLMSSVGNVLITSLISLTSNLHTPMYFFLRNLSVQDTVYVSSILPKLMAITVTGDNSISFVGCITQMFMFVFCLDAAFFLLTSMAYDRYVAICKPLHYNTIMNNRLCFLFNMSCWWGGGANGLMHSLMISKLVFCKSRNINHIFCELKTILALSCSDTSVIANIILIEGLFIGVIPFLLIVVSYMFIISTIFKIHTSSGRMKAFSSCSSHLVIVVLLYATSLGFYMKKDSEDSQEQDKFLSLLYVAVVPMLNPIVYSLRNKEVIKAMKTLVNTNKRP